MHVFFLFYFCFSFSILFHCQWIIQNSINSINRQVLFHTDNSSSSFFFSYWRAKLCVYTAYCVMMHFQRPCKFDLQYLFTVFNLKIIFLFFCIWKYEKEKKSGYLWCEYTVLSFFFSLLFFHANPLSFDISFLLCHSLRLECHSDSNRKNKNVIFISN